MLTNMVLAAVAEAALVTARHEDPDAAFDTGRRSLDTLFTRVFTHPASPLTGSPPAAPSPSFARHRPSTRLVTQVIDATDECGGCVPSVEPTASAGR